MRENNQTKYDSTIQTTNEISEIVFISEEEISAKTGADEWIMPCGHDCCTCDRECK